MKFGSKRAIFGVIWGGFEGFGPCLGISHPIHPHLVKISQKKCFFTPSQIVNNDVCMVAPSLSIFLQFIIFLQPKVQTQQPGSAVVYINVVLNMTHIPQALFQLEF